MTRYIIIDNVSGQIVGDTSIFEPTNTAYEDPFSACRDIDDERGIRNMAYHEQTVPFGREEPGYLVFIATDEDGRDKVPAITDFKDPEQIRMVRERCRPPFGVWFWEEDE